MLPCGGATATQRDAAMAYHQLIQQQQQALMHRLYQNKPSAGDVPNDDNDSNGDVFQVVGDEMMAALGRRVIVNRTAVTDASGEAGRQMMDHRGEAVRSALLQRYSAIPLRHHTTHHRQGQPEEEIHSMDHERRRRNRRVEFILQRMPDFWSIITNNAVGGLY
ncbi:hypothetical protein TcG_05719 [Trypanosoma cruzi]|uniref:Uncharacterized protein n=1 Tax=Trypanosoma cruzi Dm28c TaxID=1416333 RepID=V5BGZ7_TRYCR|nr:hypothetical protein TCDM_14330 [Trypanosoma cruzi Dm28c]RNF17348.1 hypothetical protein TcG_05719 [Trypanosoma cruzi]